MSVPCNDASAAPIVEAVAGMNMDALLVTVDSREFWAATSCGEWSAGVTWVTGGGLGGLTYSVERGENCGFVADGAERADGEEVSEVRSGTTLEGTQVGSESLHETVS